MNRMTRRSAFTLIERLAVVAIIAVLASIFMPSLARSQDLAREVSWTIGVYATPSSLDV